MHEYEKMQLWSRNKKKNVCVKGRECEIMGSNWCWLTALCCVAAAGGADEKAKGLEFPKDTQLFDSSQHFMAQRNSTNAECPKCPQMPQFYCSGSMPLPPSRPFASSLPKCPLLPSLFLPTLFIPFCWRPFLLLTLQLFTFSISEFFSSFVSLPFPSPSIFISMH